MPATLWRKLQALSATDSSPTHGRRCDAGRHPMVRKMLSSTLPMNAEAVYQTSPSVSDAEHWLALSVGAVLLIVGASRRSPGGACLAASAAPLLYRGITGRWPAALNGRVEPDSIRALGGERGVHVRKSVRLEKPVSDVYQGGDDRIERGEIDPSFIITHRIGLEDAPSMYRTFRDKHDSCIKVVMKPGAAATTTTLHSS